MDLDPDAVAHAYASGAEAYAARFGDQFQRIDVDRALVERLVERCPAGGRVLDVGCGPGQVSALVRSHGRAAVAIDLTFEMLAVARRRVAATAVVCGDVRRLPLSGACFDAVVCWYSLHNMPRTALPGALGEVRRVVRAGGGLLVATHAGAGEEWHELQWRGHPGRVVVSYYAPDELADLVEAAGFRDVEVTMRPPLPDEHPVDKVFVMATGSGP